jgi:hypothetical protein
MRGFWTYVGMYAIAGVIVASVLVLTMLVLDSKSVKPVDLLWLPIALTFFIFFSYLSCITLKDGWTGLDSLRG